MGRGGGGRRHGGERDVKYVDMDRGDPDGGEENTNNDDPSMDEVIKICQGSQETNPGQFNKQPQS